MALSSKKVLESPFSHARLYGVEHPACSSGSKLLPPTGKRKGKGSKAKRSARSLGSSEERSGFTSKPKSKKKRSGKGLSVTLPLLPGRSHAHKPLSSPASSLAQVDSDPPARKGIRTRPHFLTTPSGSSTPTGIVSSRPREHGIASKSDTPVLPSVMETDISSLLSFSKLSTSELVLSLAGARGGGASAGVGGGGASTGVGGAGVDRRLKNRGVEDHLRLPPHMQVARRVFGVGSPRLHRGVAARGGSAGAQPLDVQEVGRGLGRLQYKQVIVMSGAGISTPCGIPDFRYVLQ